MTVSAIQSTEVSALRFEHFLPVAFARLIVCPVVVLINMPLPPFLTASSAELSVYILCVPSDGGYFSSSISRVRAICCVAICCSPGSRSGTSRETVALRSSWFQSLLQSFSLLICESRNSSCVLLGCLAKWLRPCFFYRFLVGAASLLWSRWPGSLRTFSTWVRISNIVNSFKGSRSVFISISSTGVVFMASTMACSTAFWTLFSLLLLAFEAVAQEVVEYSLMGWTAPV